MANRYWVGGTGTWNATVGTKWATTSGGTGGETVPTSGDIAYLDANSGSGTVTISGTTMACNKLDCTGFTGTLAGGSTTALNIGSAAALTKSLDIPSGMTLSFTGYFVCVNTSATITKWSFGIGTVGCMLKMNGTGGKLGLLTNFATTSTYDRGVHVALGTFDISGFIITTPLFCMEASTTFICDSSSEVHLTGASSVLWELNGSGQTVTGSPKLFLDDTSSVSQKTIEPGSVTFGDMTLACTTANSVSVRFNGSVTISKFLASGTGSASFLCGSGSGQTMTVTGGANSFPNGTAAYPHTLSRASSTFTLSSSATLAFNYYTISYVTGGGAGIPFYALNSTQGTTVTNITFAKTITGSLTNSSATLSATSTFVGTGAAATASLTSGSPTLSATSTYSSGTETASASLTSTNATLSATTTYSSGTNTVTATLTDSNQTLSANSTYSSGVNSAIATLTQTSPTLAATVTYSSGITTANASLAITSQILETVVTYSSGGNTAVATLVKSNQTLATVMSYWSGTYTTTVGLTNTPQTLAANVSFTTGLTRTAIGSLTSSSQTLSAITTFVASGFPTQMGGFHCTYGGEVYELCVVAFEDAPQGCGQLRMLWQDQVRAVYLTNLEDVEASPFRISTPVGPMALRLKT